MENKYGVKNLSEILALIGTLASNIGDVAADGKVTLIELMKFVNLWPLIGPAVDNFRETGHEVLDINPIEREELVRVFSSSLRLPSPVAEGILEEGTDLALHLMQFIAKVRELKEASA